MERKTALLVIDVQNDFCEGGSLAVSGGKSIVKPINDLIDSRHWDFIVASKDWHPIDHISFASNHSGKHSLQEYEIVSKDSQTHVTSTLWPDHCVQGSHGAALVKGLDFSKFDKIVNKGENPSSEFYSAFQDVLKQDQTDLLASLQRHHITDVVVVGLAFDFCVMHTALDAVAFGFDTSIDLNCTKPISSESGAAARQKLIKAGVHLIK